MDNVTREMLDKLLQLDTKRGKSLDALSDRLDVVEDRITRLEKRLDANR